jgi:alpha-L-fucosidase 2
MRMKSDILNKQSFRVFIWSLLFFLAGAGSSVFAVGGEYLSDFDLLWNRTPKAYEESAFLGNGELGTCIWSAREETLHFDIGDTRVYSEKSRAPIGKFILKTKGKTTDFDMRLDLHKAWVKGEIKTDQGTINFQSLASIKQDVVIVEFAVAGGEKIAIEHFSLPGAPADALYAIRKDKSFQLDNPNDFSDPDTYAAIMGMEVAQKLKLEERGEVEGIQYRFVPLKGGQAYVLTWAFKKVAPNRYLLIWTTDYEQDAKALSKTAGLPVVKKALAMGMDPIEENHFAYWTDYFAKPFLSLPDKRMEANYWVQMYKYGSATRPGALPIDLMGPWFRATPWPRIWANLNVQLQYLPMPVANQPGIASTLADWIDANHSIFIQAVDQEFQHDSATCGRGTSPYGPTGFWGEYGNFHWTLYDYWHFLRVYPDDERTIQKFYPILKRANNFLLHALTKGEDGLLHMPIDTSPEWKVQAEDTTYNLELLRWGLETALYIGEHFELNDKDTARYESILKQLVAKHVDETGIMLGKDLPLTGPHRHYSHLVGLYPLRRIDVDNATERELYLKSVNHWLGFKTKQPLTRHSWDYKGYTRTGAAPMYAMLDEPEKALDQFQQYFDLYLYPNTFYLETGPVIETPLSSAATTQELLIQSWGINNYETNLIRLFPGVSSSWPEACFDGLRAEGGYTVSARSEIGQTTAFRITSDRDSTLQLRFKSDRRADVKTSKGSRWKTSALNGWQLIQLDLRKGESLFWGSADDLTKPVLDVKTKQPNFHFGLNSLSVTGAE